MFPDALPEEIKLDAMQRVWQMRRGASTSTAFFEEVNETEDLLNLHNHRPTISQRVQCIPPPQTSSCEVDSDVEVWDIQDTVLNPQEPTSIVVPEKGPLKLDASSIGDFPAQYTICPLEKHQFPVVGVFVDKRVVPGFKYKVRPLPCVERPSTINKCLFDDRALTLQSIGRGYSRRFTFEAEKNKLNNNKNYFWSDNRPEGYAFELELLSEGDKFTFFDTDKEPQGTVEVLKLEAPQIEISSSVTKDGIQKRAKVTFTGKVELYETGVAKPMHLSGVVVSVKPRNKPSAEIVKVVNVNIKRHTYYLIPGMQKIHRRVTVRGQDINDIPTKYSMTGLEPYEIPVVGTYVDPRIIPGFSYRVRPNDRKEHLFGGRSLKLLSIGMGYAKRLTFQPDSLVAPDNYLWSDSHPDGLGLEPRGVHKGMKFFIKAGDCVLGEAEVFRDDLPQFEERMEKIKTPTGHAIQKYIHIDVICHIKLARTGGGINGERRTTHEGLRIGRCEKRT